MAEIKNMERALMEERAKEQHKRLRRKHRINSGIRYFILVVGAIIMLYPMLWLIGASFKTNSEIFTSIGIIPNKIDFAPYIKGWKTGTEYTFATYFKNSFKVLIPKVVFTIISCSLTAYGFARFDFPFKKQFFGLLISTLLLPQVVLRIPTYLLWKKFRLLDTHASLFLNSAFAVDGFFVFMLIQFFRSIPKELDESAIVDGCNSFGIFWHILLPLMKPALVSVGLFQFMWTMNDFMGPLIYISSVEKYPVSIALKMCIDATSGTFEWNQVIAMSIIALLPSIILFFSAQKYFIEGIATTGIKG